MKSGAVIVAAGMSSRMGDFKPMLSIGSMSIVKRIVATLKQAGIEDIVMVTGFNADMLEHHLTGNGIVFLRNENYEHTQMFDSAKIGIEYLANKCNRIVFTPVDIPLFTSTTVFSLLASKGEIVVPVCRGEQGHPIIFSSAVAKSIASDSGEEGIRGALMRSGAETVFIEVEDEGILQDADTPQDYQKLLAQHNRQLVRPLVSVTIARETSFFDSKAAMLLQLIDETDSVSTACQRMQISYSAGWNTLRNLETQMKKTMVERSQGGAGGGKSILTEDGRDFLRRYKEYEAAIREVAAEQFPRYFENIF
ncbi:MAG: NTP transferase domain-containing protein [Eubacteriales bacterium]|nr:NTP transferase domain-containing protein [Eubacteriales bacterium]